MKFNNETIAANVEKRTKVFDSGMKASVKGLFASITPAGTRTFSFRYWVAAKGDYDYLPVGTFLAGTFGVDQAREKAEKLYANVVLGADVAADHRKAVAVASQDASKADMTLNAVADAFMVFVKTPVEKADGGMRPRVERWENVVSLLKPARKAFGSTRFREVSGTEIMKLVTSFYAQGKIARGNKVRATLIQLYGWSCEIGNDYCLPTANPCVALPPPLPLGAKQRRLNPDEIRRVWWGVEQEGAPVERREALALRMILATAMRPGGEVAEALRAEIVYNDDGEREYHCPLDRGKERRPIHLPVTTLAGEIIDELLALPENRKGTLFPLSSKHEPLSAGRLAEALRGRPDRKEVGLCEFLGFTAEPDHKRDVKWSPFTPHVLRASAATLLQEDGVAQYLISQVLDHQKGDKDASDTTSVYTRAKNLAHLKRPTLERLEQLIGMCIDKARPEGMSLRAWERQQVKAAPVDTAKLQAQIAELQAQLAAASKVVQLRAA